MAGDSHEPALNPCCLTRDLPGIAGVIKSSPEDFVVEEIPAYMPCGEGEHLFLWIEKRDVAAAELVDHLARVFEVRSGDVGVAGLKDRYAVTRQHVSVPAVAQERLPRVETECIQVIRATRHRNKLRTGHLKGNRFEILARDVCPDAMSRAAVIAEVIRRDGFPNYYGAQRFGHNAETLMLGLELLTGGRRPGDLPPKRRRFLLRLALSSVQSALFNDVISARVGGGRLFQVILGDVMQVVASGGCFVVDDATREQQRYDTRETVLTGPLFGPRMISPVGDVGLREGRSLERYGLSLESFRRFRKQLPGARRAAVVWPDELVVTQEREGLRFRFVLPAGAYATVLMQEFMKAALRTADSTTESD